MTLGTLSRFATLTPGLAPPASFTSDATRSVLGRAIEAAR